MDKLPKLFIALSPVVAMAISGCATANVTAPTTGSVTAASVVNGSAQRYVPTRSAAQLVTPLTELEYGGGPVLVRPKLYLDFWGYKTYGDPDRVAPLLTKYVGAMGGSGHNNIYTQYYEERNDKKTDIANPRMQLGSVWYDETNKVPKSPTDAQIAAEALAAHNHFGATFEDLFVVATPQGRSTAGFGTEWCAYHDAHKFNGHVYYVNLPYMPDAGSNCGANFISPPQDESGTDEGVTIIGGYMEGDSVIDPDPNTGWWDGGNGDDCAWVDVENDQFGKNSYTMQPMWSNAAGGCVQTYQ